MSLETSNSKFSWREFLSREFASVEFMSWPLAGDTPAYGDKNGVQIRSVKSLVCGDTCNSLHLEMSNHSGTHVDAPLHFVSEGKSIDSYNVMELYFDNVQLIELPMTTGRLITESDFASHSPSAETQFLLLKTGFGEMRQEENYIFDGPGLSGGAATAILSKWPNLRALGLDFLSINRWTAKSEGRLAHRILLDANHRLIIEDMDLRQITTTHKPQSIQILPLRIRGGDGAPATVVGYFSKADQ